jgi:sRNA-binding regulator protein Hfq
MKNKDLKQLYIENAMNSKEAFFIFLKNSIKIEGFIEACRSRTSLVRG